MASLFYRKDRGCWYLQYVVGGVRRKEKALPSKRDSELLLAKRLVEIGQGGPGARTDQRMTLRQFVDDEYMPWAEGAKAAGTLKRERLTVRTWVEVVGDRPMAAIDPRMAARFQAKRQKVVSRRTVNLDVRGISHILNQAVRWGILERNPLQGVPKLREEQRQPRWLTTEEIDALMDAAPDRLRATLVTFLNTGLRKGELVRLEWKDVDLGGKYLVVRHKGDQTTKSRRERTVDLNELTVGTLRHHRRQVRAQYGELPRTVFVTKRRTPVANNLHRDIREVYEAAGIEGANIHSLRHTFGAQAVMAGMDLPTLQQLMGHSDVSTTMVYAHVDRRHTRQEINKLALGASQTADVASIAEARSEREAKAG